MYYALAETVEEVEKRPRPTRKDLKSFVYNWRKIKFQLSIIGIGVTDHYDPYLDRWLWVFIFPFVMVEVMLYRPVKKE